MTLTRDELRSLAQTPTKGPCVSLFLPTHQAGPPVRQDPIRLKNLLGEAEERALAIGLSRAEVDDVLAPLRALVADEGFWRERARGLAIFAAPGFLVVDRLPAAVDEGAFAGHRFLLKPLLRFLTGDGRYAVLAISRNHVRCFLGSRESLTPLPLRGIPTRLEDAVGTDVEQQSLQSRTGTAKTGDGRGRAIFHTHRGGGDEDERKRELAHFVEMIDAGLDETLPRRTDPLVLAGTEEVVAAFRATSRRRSLVEKAALGNPDGWSEEEIHARTWPLVEPRFLEARRQAAEKFPELRAHGRASDDLRTVIFAAAEGRIAELFAALDATCWGRFDFASRTLEIHDEPGPDDQDLIDEIAVQTLLHDGTVYCVEGRAIPGAGPVAANFRYPLHERTGQPQRSSSRRISSFDGT